MPKKKKSLVVRHFRKIKKVEINSGEEECYYHQPILQAYDSNNKEWYDVPLVWEKAKDCKNIKQFRKERKKRDRDYEEKRRKERKEDEVSTGRNSISTRQNAYGLGVYAP